MALIEKAKNEWPKLEKFPVNPDGTIDTREYAINALIDTVEKLKELIK